MSFIAAGIGFAFSLVLAVTPAIALGGSSAEGGVYPAPPGYLLPWAGGEIHSVTQGEDTTFTHNGLTAYAFDFDLNYETVVAARSGKVVMVRENSNAGGCSSFYANSSNYVVIDHGDGTAGSYLHLAYNTVEVEVGQIVARGEALAISGETGVTCSDVDGGPGPHLHFQVQTYAENKYLTQSQPVAFDDIHTSDGVARYGVSYASANYGPGKPQKIKLTPHRVPRVFNPLAKPLLPDLIADEELQATPSAVVPPPEDTPTPTQTAVPLIESYTTWEPTPSEDARADTDRDAGPRGDRGYRSDAADASPTTAVVHAAATDGHPGAASANRYASSRSGYGNTQFPDGFSRPYLVLGCDMPRRFARAHAPARSGAPWPSRPTHRCPFATRHAGDQQEPQREHRLAGLAGCPRAPVAVGAQRRRRGAGRALCRRGWHRGRRNWRIAASGFPQAGALAIDVGSSAVIARDVGAGDRSRVQAGLHAALLVAVVWGLCLRGHDLHVRATVHARGWARILRFRRLGVQFLRAARFGLPFLTVFYAVAGVVARYGQRLDVDAHPDRRSIW